MKLHNLLLAAALMTLTACQPKSCPDIHYLANEECALNLLKYGPMVEKLHDYTVNVCYNVSAENELDGYGHFLFAFSSLSENKAEEGPYMAMRLNEQRFEVSTGGWNHESAIMVGTQPERNTWHHALYRQAGRTGELFIDGKLIGRNDSMPILDSIFTESPAFCWMGLAPFKGDKALVGTQVAAFTILDHAATDEEIRAFDSEFACLKEKK